MSSSRARRGLRRRLFAFALAKFHGKYEGFVAGRKRTLFTDLAGHVLEIGPGTGANLRYYPRDIRWIGVEPNPYLHPYLEREAERNGLRIEIRNNRAEQLELDDASVDAVVSTLVLCSVEDVSASLREIRRVLRPGGRFIFVEHVAAPPGTCLHRLQRCLRPFSRFFADGCCPDRETGRAIEAARFDTLRYEKFRVAVPVVSPHIAGVATRPRD